MGKGFALELRREFPVAYLAYYSEHRASQFETGDIVFVLCKPGVHVANCITQEYYGRDKSVVYVDYRAVRTCLRNVARYARVNDLSVHLPFIGGGNAHGDPNVLMGIFTETLDDVDSTLWIQG